MNIATLTSNWTLFTSGMYNDLIPNQVFIFYLYRLRIVCNNVKFNSKACMQSAVREGVKFTTSTHCGGAGKPQFGTKLASVFGFASLYNLQQFLLHQLSRPSPFLYIPTVFAHAFSFCAPVSMTFFTGILLRKNTELFTGEGVYKILAMMLE